MNGEGILFPFELMHKIKPQFLTAYFGLCGGLWLVFILIVAYGLPQGLFPACKIITDHRPLSQP